MQTSIEQAFGNMVPVPRRVMTEEAALEDFAARAWDTLCDYPILGQYSLAEVLRKAAEGEEEREAEMARAAMAAMRPEEDE